jgi:hypothetical protein
MVRPIPPLQLTASRARLGLFGVILCSAHAAAEWQAVGPPPFNAILRDAALSAGIIDARFRRVCRQGGVMHHKLILFTGAGSGAGKSTLSAFLAQQFTAHAIPTRWIYEEDTLDAFTPFFQALRQKQLNTLDLFLDATRRLVLACQVQPSVCIVDSLLPGYGFFFGAHPLTAIAALTTELASILAPLQPLLVYMDSDVGVALNRAIAQRGSAWFERMVQRMNSWNLPLYPGKPFSDQPSVIAFDQQARQFALRLLDYWPIPKLMLTTDDTPLGQLKTQLLNYFQLDELPVRTGVDSDLLASYCGTYAARDGATTEPAVEIRCVAGQLVINRYWPNGTALVAEDLRQFRLENTNYRVIFELQTNERIKELTLLYRDRRQQYTKIN